MFKFRRKKLIFLYGERYKYSGSTVMRGQQLSKIVKQHLGKTYKVRYRTAKSSYSNSILFLTKGAIQSLNEKDLEKLKNKSNILLFDPVDSLPKQEKIDFADAIICASQAEYNEYSSRPQDTPCFVVDHHVDPRVPNINTDRELRSLRIGYFGELVNTTRTEKIDKLVDFTGVDTSKKSEDWFEELRKYNLHYTIRNSENVGVHKPFLKGFTAARVNANVIAHKSQTDAIRWLGEDYPYLVKGKLNEKNILSALQYAKETYGTEIWDKATEKMNNIKSATSDEAIVNQLQTALAAVQEKRK